MARKDRNIQELVIYEGEKNRRREVAWQFFVGYESFVSYVEGLEDGQYIDLAGEDLNDFDFSGLNLRQTNFMNADLRNADFTGADLYGVNFQNADLTGAIITPEQLAGTRGKPRIGPEGPLPAKHIHHLKKRTPQKRRMP